MIKAWKGRQNRRNDFAPRVREVWNTPRAWPVENIESNYLYNMEYDEVIKNVPRNQEMGLDVGAGWGRFTLFLAGEACKKVISVDICKNMLDEGKCRAEKAGFNSIDFVEADAQHLPFERNSFSVIIAAQVIGSILKRENFIMELQRVAKPNATVILTFGNVFSLIEMQHRLRFIRKCLRIRHIIKDLLGIGEGNFFKILNAFFGSRYFWIRERTWHRERLSDIKRMLAKHNFIIQNVSYVGVFDIFKEKGKQFEFLRRYAPLKYLSHLIIVKAVKTEKRETPLALKWLFYREKLDSLYNRFISDRRALNLAMGWLCRAHDIHGKKGIAAFYDIKLRHWASEYPETTGYTIPTFLDYYRLTGKKAYRERAIQMADWECGIQLPEGGVRAARMDAKVVAPTIFNTGQVILGWIGAYRETHDEKYLTALSKAALWLSLVQDQDGAWRRYPSPVCSNSVNVYNTRTAWALLEAYEVTGDSTFLDKAYKNIKWALLNQKKNGWFKYCGLSDNRRPLLHTIAYTARGILEAGLFLKDAKFIKFARITADALSGLQKTQKVLYGRYNESWKPAVNWACLTGVAQMAIVWLRLYEHTRKKEYRERARQAIHQIKKTQMILSYNRDMKGGIKGSYPIDGGYAPFKSLNWATKFFADALMLETKLSP